MVEQGACVEGAAGVAVPEVAAEVADEGVAVDALGDLQDCMGAVRVEVVRVEVVTAVAAV